MSENEEAWNQWCATTDLEFSDPSEQREGFDAGWDAHKALTPQPTGDVAELIAEQLPEGTRMHAYYYGFDRTGLAAIDLILSAVATAGKGYHHIE